MMTEEEKDDGRRKKGDDMKEETYLYNERYVAFIISEYLIKWWFTSGHFNYSTSKRPDISLYVYNNKR